MDIILIFIIILIVIIGLIILSYLFGSTFRHWNEGDRFNKEKSKTSNIKTFVIGLIILIVIILIISKCVG